MCGGSKSKTNQTGTYRPTDEAGAFYSDVMGKASTAAGTPYNPATGKTIAGFDPAQLQAFQGVQNAQGTGQGSLDAAGQLIDQGGAPISASQIQHYMDPFQQQVIDAAVAQMNRQNATAQSGVAGNFASQQALGGNRVGVAQANLAGEQGRNSNSMIAGLLSSGFQGALGAAQNDAGRQLQAGQQRMNLGQVQQNMTYADLQALLASGGQQQQQQQSVNDAASANATAETMFPFQQAQWQAGIGAALGPLTGSTTTGTATTSTPKGAGQVVGAGLTAASMLSDRRTKEDVKPIGKTFDGQTVYSYRFKGSPKQQIGLMADEVRQSHPDAVGQHPSGFEMVDYGRATDDAADRGGFARGGGVDFGSFEGMWNELKPSAPIIPQAPSPPQQAAAGSGQSMEGAVSLGKNARSGIDNILRQLSPTKGWAEGTTIEPTAGAGAASGKGAGIGSLFGFGAGGGVRLDKVQHADPRRRLEPEEMPMAMGDPDFLDVPGYRFDPETNSYITSQPITEGRAMPEGYAPGGGVNFMDLFNSLQDKPKLKDEFIGEIGPSGEAPEAPLSMPQGESAGIPPEQNPWGMRGMAPTYQGKTLADFLGGKAPIDIGTEAMPTIGPDSGTGIPPVPERAPQPASLEAPAGLSLGDASELQNELTAAPETTVENHTAGQGLSTIDFIKSQEGLKLRAYPDGRQNSVGYGTKALSPDERITPEEAERRLFREVGHVETWLDKNIKVPLTQGQRAGLTSFGFNLGVDDLERLKGDINAGRWDRVTMRMPSFNRFQGEPLDALTDRRLREVALINGESAPASSGGVQNVAGAAGSDTIAGGASPQVSGMVARATSPDAPVVSSYTGPKDKATGGLLKSLFGVDFNPLKLDEDERLALMAAGLSMMSSGDIGGGGLAGLNFLNKSRAAKRDAASDAQKLALQMAQTEAISRGKWSLSPDGTMLVNDATGQVKPSGGEKAQTDTPAMKEYALAQDQGFKGSFAEFESERKLNTVKGTIPAEASGRIGLADQFFTEFPTIRARVAKGFGAKDRAGSLLDAGEMALVKTQIATGMDALVRMNTGAAMPASEEANYNRRYQISETDKPERMMAKLDKLKVDLQSARDTIIKGATGELARGSKSTPSKVQKWERGADGLPVMVQ